MSIIDPIRTRVALDPLNLGFTNFPNAQPFSPRDAVGYQALLEGLYAYVTRDVYTALTQSNGQATWDANVDKLLDAINTTLDQQKSDIDAETEAALQAVINSAISVSDPVVLALLQSQTTATHEWLRTAFGSYQLAGPGIDPTGAAPSTTAVQSFFDALPDGASALIPGGVMISLDASITITKRVHLSGNGILTFTNADAIEALVIRGDNTVLDGVQLRYPAQTAAQSGNKQAGISINAHNVTITNCTVDGFQQAIAVQPFGEYVGTIITHNHVLNVPGSGDGPSSGSSNGEDRGDGIVVWGAEAVVVGNRVSAKSGTDARIGIHTEGLPNLEGTPGPHSSSLVTIVGNEVSGKFRRSIACEGVAATNISGNTVADATWWALDVVGGDGSVCSNNTIIWTRTSTDNQGQAFAPNRSAIMVYGAGKNTVVHGNVVKVMPGATMPFGISAQTNGAGTREGLSIKDNVLRDEQGTMYAAIYVNGGGGVISDVVIAENIVEGFNNFGLYTWNCADPEISRNRITGPSGKSATAIVADGNGSGARADANTIMNADTAIKLVGRNSLTTAKNNLVYNANIGIDYTGTQAIGAEGNTMIGVTTATKNA